MSLTGRTKRLLTIGLPAAALVVGGTGVASAATSSHPRSPSTHESDQGEHAPTYRSSVRAPEKEYATDAAEHAALTKLATVTPDQAKRTAAAANHGTVTDIALEDDNGNVVYSVELRTTKGTVETAVDAGNGKLLAQETETADHDRADQDRADSGQQNGAPDADQGRSDSLGR